LPHTAQPEYPFPYTLRQDSGNKINIIVQNDVDEVLMHSHDFDENPLIKFLKNRKPIDRSGIYWGNKTDAEMEEYNKTAHW
jgi:predicted mannosyl-3-phosphoglycerate phosphatase (HAD superfamily)